MNFCKSKHFDLNIFNRLAKICLLVFAKRSIFRSQVNAPLTSKSGEHELYICELRPVMKNSNRAKRIKIKIWKESSCEKYGHHHHHHHYTGVHMCIQKKCQVLFTYFMTVYMLLSQAPGDIYFSNYKRLVPST